MQWSKRKTPGIPVFVIDLQDTAKGHIASFESVKPEIIREVPSGARTHRLIQNLTAYIE